jgi:UDP-N-acetyl-D-galactosamine dehydrogenase
MGAHVGELAVRQLNSAGRLPRDANVWVLGMTFKENVPDYRNTRAVDVVRQLQSFGCRVTTWEPMIPADEIQRQFGLSTVTWEQARDLDAVVLINAHDAFRVIRLPELRARMRTPVLVDVKNFFPRAEAAALGIHYVSL